MLEEKKQLLAEIEEREAADPGDEEYRLKEEVCKMFDEAFIDSDVNTSITSTIDKSICYLEGKDR